MDFGAKRKRPEFFGPFDATIRVTMLVENKQKNNYFSVLRSVLLQGFVLSRPISRCSNLVPCFLYASDPAKRKASQIRATLCPSRTAIVSSSFFKSERTLKVRRVSFFIRRILALDLHSHYCASGTLLTFVPFYVILLSDVCHPLEA